MKITKKIKTFEEYKKIDDMFSKEEAEEAQEVEDIDKTAEEVKEEEELEDEEEMEEEEEEKVWGDENELVERFKTFEAHQIDKEFALKDIKKHNKEVVSLEDEDKYNLLEDTVISIIKNLGFKDSSLNVDAIMDHIGSSQNGDIIPEDIIDEIFDILNDNNKISEEYNKSEYFEQTEIDELKKLLPHLKQANSILNRQEIINWFNENDIDYFNMTDMEMFIYYIENN